MTTATTKTSADSATRLTEPQRSAAQSVDRSAAVVAGAGSGKTTVLIERCLSIIGSTPSEIEHLLAITFTEKAAAELKSRLRMKLARREHFRLATAWIGTFHGSSARILRQHAPLIGLDPSFSILDENASQLIQKNVVRGVLLQGLEKRDPQIAHLVDALDFRNASLFLQNLMDFRWHARRALLAPRSDTPEEEKLLESASHAFDLCEKTYREELNEVSSLDFQELEIKVLELLDQNPQILKTYQKKFRHILVDEFQDTNDLQTELVFRLHGANHLCIVGDPRQSIYRFRGANVDCFAHALAHIRKSGGKVVPLMENFRSRPDIISFVNRASGRLADGLFGTHPDDEVLTIRAEELKASRADEDKGPAVVNLTLDLPEKITSNARRKSEAEAIACYIEKLVEGGKFRFGDIACLFQAMTDVSAYEAAFKSHSLPYRFFGGRGLMDRQEICDLMHAVRYAADPSDDVALLGLLRSPLIGISDDECARLAGPEGDALRENARAHPSCTILRELEARAPHEMPSELLQFTLDHTGYDFVLQNLDPSGGSRAAVDRLILMAQSLERQAPTTLGEFVSFVQHLRDRNARLGDPPATGDAANAVHCMTVHTAKGLEFPVVVLPDLIRKGPNQTQSWIFHRSAGLAFKLKDPLHPFGQRIATPRFEEISGIEKFESEAEHARLLYVAMTRARDCLVIPTHEGSQINGRWHEWLKPLMSEGVDNMHIDSCDSERAEGEPRPACRTGRDPLQLKSKIQISKSKANPKSQIQIKSNALSLGNSTSGSRLPANGLVEGFAGRASEFLIFSREKAWTKSRKREMTFSVSQLEAFDRCPQEYYLKYVLALPSSNLLSEKTEALPANVRGSIVHAVLEELTPKSKHKLDDIIENACSANQVIATPAIVEAVSKPVREFMATELFAHADDGRRETRFDWRIGSHTITGCIDWYRENDGGLEIIDFKTDQVDRAGATLRAQEYELQMISYALALEGATGSNVEKTTLVFLMPQVVLSAKVDESRRNEGMDRMRGCIEKIIAEDFRITQTSPPCYKCPYHHNGLCWEDRLTTDD